MSQEAAGRAREARDQQAERLLARSPVVVQVSGVLPAWPKEYAPLTLLLLDTSQRLSQELGWPVDYSVDELGAVGWLAGDADPRELKERLLAIEAEALGRFLDLDVLTCSAGRPRPLGRADLGRPERTCFLCPQPASVCRRQGRHDVRELRAFAELSLADGLFGGSYFTVFSEMARAALAQELARRHGFGSVTLNGPGSHRDMDAALLLRAGRALASQLAELTAADTLSFAALRRRGRELEARLLEASQGVNTYKGSLFAFLLVLAAHYPRRSELAALSERAAFGASLSAAIRDFSLALKADYQTLEARTAGEKSYLRYGLGGARDSALEGYESLLVRHWPRYAVSGRLDDIIAPILASTWDTTTLNRGGYGMLLTLRRMALGAHSDFDRRLLSAWCEERGLSTGGSADLVALLHLVELLYRERVRLAGL